MQAQEHGRTTKLGARTAFGNMTAQLMNLYTASQIMHSMHSGVFEFAVCFCPLLLQYVPCVEEIDSTIKIAGGINSPLILKVTDSYGRVQRQLCKCNDDLRQVRQLLATLQSNMS